MRKSIYIRNFYTTAGIVLLSFLILGSVFFFWSYKFLMGEKKEAMYSTAGEVGKVIRAFSANYDPNDPTQSISLDPNSRIWLTVISLTSGFDILLADETGTIVSTTDLQFASPQKGKSIPSAILAMIENGSSFIRNADLDDLYGENRTVMGLTLIGSGSRTIGYIILSSSSNNLIEIWRQFFGIFLFISAVVLLLTFVLSFITTKRQAEPLNEMAQAARRFARGDFKIRVENEGRIDEIGQLTEAFNLMADSLERSERLRRDFIANVSHELKTPMTVISGFSDGILDGTIPVENERKYLEVISSETKRLSRLVRTMLDMSRIQSAASETILLGTFDVSEIIRVTLLGLGGKIDAKALDVEAELPEEPIITRGDKDSITQVVYNLIDNAVKFAEKGSVIKVCLWKQGAKAYVSVENHGETIPAEEMPLIFDRFHKMDRSRSENRDGVGLGLYIVKTILDNHNEDIFVKSADGATTFTFTLTLAAH